MTIESVTLHAAADEQQLRESVGDGAVVTRKLCRCRRCPVASVGGYGSKRLFVADVDLVVWPPRENFFVNKEC